MQLVPTDGPGYVKVVTHARRAASYMPPELAHMFLVLATHAPNIFPSNTSLAADLHVDPRTVERNLRRLHDLGHLSTLQANRGFERGGRA